MYIFLGNTDIRMYELVGYLGFIPIILYGLTLYREQEKRLSISSQRMVLLIKRINRKAAKRARTFFVYSDIYNTILMIGLIAGLVNRPFGKLVGTGANYFGMLFTITFAFAFLCITATSNVLKQVDMVMPAMPMILSVAKMACFCAGCCGGIESEYGLYNERSGLKEIPVQLIEAAVALLLFIFLLWYKKRAKPGTMLPIYMILYSVTRFFTEFLRKEENVLGPLKMHQILCIICVVYGIVEWVLIAKFRDKIDAFFERRIENAEAGFAAFEEQNRESWEKIDKQKEREKKNKKMYSKSRRL